MDVITSPGLATKEKSSFPPVVFDVTVDKVSVISPFTTAYIDPSNVSVSNTKSPTFANSTYSTYSRISFNASGDKYENTSILDASCNKSLVRFFFAVRSGVGDSCTFRPRVSASGVVGSSCRPNAFSFANFSSFCDNDVSMAVSSASSSSSKSSKKD